MTITIPNSHAIVPARKSNSWVDPTLYPFSARRFQTSDGVVSYVDEGNGAPILFVHGTPSWSFEWRSVIGELSREYRCIAPDHLGFGMSDKPEGAPLAPQDHARRLRGLVEALDLRDITLVVHDFGGPIGLPIALDMPERVRRVVVINSWMWSVEADPTVQRIDRFVRSAMGRFMYRWLNASPRFLLPATFAEKKRLTRAIHRQYIAPFATRGTRAAPYELAKALHGASSYYESLWERRSALQGKLSIVWGDRDPAFGEQHRTRWAQAFPEAQVSRVADAGHFVAEERPDAVVAAIRLG